MKNIYILCFFLFLSACAINRVPSLNMLEKRSDYAGLRQVEEDLSSLGGPLLIPQRTQSTVTDIWVHPHEMPTGDYFRGGWIRTVISSPKWTIEQKSSTLFLKRKGPNKNHNNKY